jgi:hypothetical protein
MKRYFLLIFIFFTTITFSFAYTDSIPEKKKWRLDSNYVANYSEKLVIGIYQSWRYYDLLMTQSLTTDSTGISQMNYIARGNNSSGLSFAYDKISFSLSTSVEATEIDIFRKGISQTRNLSVAINSKRYRLEMAYRKYTGFYDDYYSKRDTAFTDTSAYYQIPTMFSKAYRLKGFYFFNKKQRFSYGAAFNNTARQLKTAGSFLLVSNLYTFSLATDSSFLAPGTAPFYPQWENWNKFKTFGFSANFGYTFNLVFLKKLFVNLTGTLGAELQSRQYSTLGNTSQKQDWKFGVSAGDLRGSIGFNSDRIYIMLSYIGDFSVYKLDKLEIYTRLHAGMFSFGYRFKMKESKPIKWLKNNKIYRML